MPDKVTVIHRLSTLRHELVNNSSTITSILMAIGERRADVENPATIRRLDFATVASERLFKCLTIVMQSLTEIAVSGTPQNIDDALTEMLDKTTTSSDIRPVLSIVQTNGDRRPLRRMREDGFKIFVVDDDEDYNFLLKYALEKRGHVVETEHRVDVALAKLCHEKGKWDMVIVDKHIGPFDGLHLLAFIEPLTRGTIRILYSGLDPGITDPGVMPLGVDYCISKGFSTVDLANTLSKLIEESIAP